MFLSLLPVNVRGEPGRRWLNDIYRVHQRLWMGFPDDVRLADDPFFLGPWDGPGIPEPKPKRREAGFLFRIERDGSPRILVQSVERPNWKYAFQNAPYLLSGESQVRQFDPAPRRDQHYRFRLLANVVTSKSVVHPDGKTRTTRAGLTISRRRRTEVAVRPQPVPDPLPVDPIERERVLLARWEPWRSWLHHAGQERGFCLEESSSLLMGAIHTSVCNPNKDPDPSSQEKPTEKRYNAGLFDGVLVCTDADRLRDAIVDGIGHAKAFGFGLLSLAPA